MQEAVEQKKAAVAQDECPFAAKPQAEHEWLHQMLGEWACEGEAVMQPGQPTVKWKATETVRSLGGLWVVGEGTGDTPTGGKSQTIVTLGYDPAKGKYVGTFTASMMANMWIYEGEREGTVLTLRTKGPGMTPDVPLANYKDVVDLKSRDLRTLTSFVEMPDGQWLQMMSATYRRTA